MTGHLTEPTTGPAAESVRVLDDFAEFTASSYREVIDAFAHAGLRVTIAAAAGGYYLHVTTATAVATSDASSASLAVEVTDEGRPLPDAPSDVSAWALTTPAGTVLVPRSEEPDALAQTARDLLNY